MDLFDHAKDELLRQKAPLAARMRPRTLDEYVGQQHILGPGRLLRRAIQADQLTSLIFYGPPGTGKTTLAQIIANTTRAHFDAINAVLAGVADIRRAVADAETRLGQHGRRTILFVDEVHRFNKSQQDALLPHVEFGTLILIGATTENPYFEVNKTILSRSRIFELKPLDDAALEQIILAVLADSERGFGDRAVEVDPDAMAHLVRVSNGDARTVLNALELAVETTPADANGKIHIRQIEAEESIQRKAVLYDKEGDAHFDAISAFIKSLRGSDPDAALYWLARMVYAGEDPRFLLRRMLIFAAEDIGLADPGALGVTIAAAEAFDFVGLPEGRFHLAEACLYLATAPKSNSTMAFFDAMHAVEKEQTGEVPNHLKDGNRDAAGLGHGEGYLYPHAFRDHWVAQQYLPDTLRGRVFYQPGDQGHEGQLAERVQRLREAQLEAWREGTATWEQHLADGITGVHNPSHIMTQGDQSGDDWRVRGEGTLGIHLERLRTRAFELLEVGRHHLVLDANAGGGLFVWEALRRAKEGGVWCRVNTEPEAMALREQANALPLLAAPVVLHGEIDAMATLVAQQESQPVPFDRIIARGLLAMESNRPARIAKLTGYLARKGRLLLIEPVPSLGERLLAGLDWHALGKKLGERARAAEEAIYNDPDDPRVNWDEGTLVEWCQAAGLKLLSREVLRHPLELPIGPKQLERWFGTIHATKKMAGTPDHHVGKLGSLLGDDAAVVRKHLEQTFIRTPLRRKIAVAVVMAEKVD